MKKSIALLVVALFFMVTFIGISTVTAQNVSWVYSLKRNWKTLPQDAINYEYNLKLLYTQIEKNAGGTRITVKPGATFFFNDAAGCLEKYCPWGNAQDPAALVEAYKDSLGVTGAGACDVASHFNNTAKKYSGVTCTNVTWRQDRHPAMPGVDPLNTVWIFRFAAHANGQLNSGESNLVCVNNTDSDVSFVWNRDEENVRMWMEGTGLTLASTPTPVPGASSSSNAVVITPIPTIDPNNPPSTESRNPQGDLKITVPGGSQIDVVNVLIGFAVVMGLLFVIVLWFSSRSNRARAKMAIGNALVRGDDAYQEIRERSRSSIFLWALRGAYSTATKLMAVLIVSVFVIAPPATKQIIALGVRKSWEQGHLLIQSKVLYLLLAAIFIDAFRAARRAKKEASIPKNAIVVYTGERSSWFGRFVKSLGLLVGMTMSLCAVSYLALVKPMLDQISQNVVGAQDYVSSFGGLIGALNEFGWGIPKSAVDSVSQFLGWLGQNQQVLDWTAWGWLIIGLLVVAFVSFGKQGVALAVVVFTFGGLAFVYASYAWGAPHPTVPNPVVQTTPSARTPVPTQPPAFQPPKPTPNTDDVGIQFNCNFNPIEAGLGPVKVSCDENGLVRFPIKYWNGVYVDFWIDPEILADSWRASSGRKDLTLAMVTVSHSESTQYQNTVPSPVGAGGSWQFMPTTWYNSANGMGYAPAGYEDPDYRWDRQIAAMGAANLIGDGNPANGSGGMRLYEKLEHDAFVSCFMGQTCPTWNAHYGQADYAFRLYRALRVAANVQ